MSFRIALVFALASILSACGTRVPQINEAWEPADVDDELVYRIVKSIRCELVEAAKEWREKTYRIGPVHRARYLPDDWGAQLTMNLSADEISGVNPSGSYNRNISAAKDVLASGGTVPQSFSLPVTTEVSSQAVRTDTYYFFYTVPELVRDRAIQTVCATYNPATKEADLPLDRSGSSYFLSGKLGIRDWMRNALIVSNEIPQSKFPDSKNLEVLQYKIKFVVMTSASINPLWKLAPVTTGVGLPLFKTGRTRTHDLVLTLGPTDVEKGVRTPVNSAASLHTAGQLEQAVSNGFRAALGR